TGGEFGIGLDQGYGQARVDALQHAGAGRAGEAAADDDDAAARALPQYRQRQQRRRGAAGGGFEKRAAAGAVADHDRTPVQFFCAASQAAMALVSSSLKPLAMRSMTVAGRWPVRKSRIAA